MADTPEANVGGENKGAATENTEAKGYGFHTSDADDFTTQAIEAALEEERNAGKSGVVSEEDIAAAENEAEEGTEEAPKEKPKAERPENIPAKFWDEEKGEARWDDLAKAYGELEKKFGVRAKAPEASTEEASKKEGEGETTEENATEETEQNETVAEVLSTEEFNKEYQETGTLSEETKAKAAERLKGVFGEDAAEMVEGYLEGLNLRTQRVLSDLKGLAGGDEAYTQLAQWAIDNLPEADQKAFDADVTSTPEKARVAIRELVLKFKEAGGAENLPNLTHGKGGNGKGGDVYASQDEINKDISDPRYDKDPAFRAKVDAKIERSVS